MDNRRSSVGTYTFPIVVLLPIEYNIVLDVLVSPLDLGVFISNKLVPNNTRHFQVLLPQIFNKFPSCFYIIYANDFKTVKNSTV